MKILIVEDDSFYAQRLKELLEDRGFDTTVAKSLEEAVTVKLDDFAAVPLGCNAPQ